MDEELERQSGDGFVFFIHTKFLLVDPLSDDPLVCTGSANFSGASLKSNDENMILVRGDTRVADIYLKEQESPAAAAIPVQRLCNRLCAQRVLR